MNISKVRSMPNQKKSNKNESKSKNSLNGDGAINADIRSDHDYYVSGKRNDSEIGVQFSLLGSPLREYIDKISSSDNEEESDWLFKCICENRYEHLDLICCDKCNYWQHIQCLGIDQNNIPASYYCHDCQKTELKKDLTNNITIKSSPIKFEQNHKIPIDNNIHHNVYTQASIYTDNLNINNEEKKEISIPYEDAKTKCSCEIEIKLQFKMSKWHAYNVEWLGQKNSHAFTLKNGKKILKLSKHLDIDRYICDFEVGEMHILNKCSLFMEKYDESSQYIYLMDISNSTTIAFDCRESNASTKNIRRCCMPNSEFSYGFTDNSDVLKIYLRSIRTIEKHREITISIDRSKEFIQKYIQPEVKSIPKCEYLSSLICLCKYRSDRDNNQPCNIALIKKMLNSHISGPVARKKSPDSLYHRSNKISKTTRSSISSSSDSTISSAVGEEASKNDIAPPPPPLVVMSREQKKVDYWVKVISEMEDKNDKKKIKRGRKPKNYTSGTNSSSYNDYKSKINNESTVKVENESQTTDSITTTNNINQSSLLGGISENTSNQIIKPGWFMNQEEIDYFIKNYDKINENLQNLISPLSSSESIQNYRSIHFPLKLAFKKGLYHLVSGINVITPNIPCVNKYPNYRRKQLFQLREEYLSKKSFKDQSINNESDMKNNDTANSSFNTCNITDLPITQSNDNIYSL